MNMPRKGMKHLTEKDRYTLEYMVKSGMKVADIAKELCHSRSTIYRELQRGKTKQITSSLQEVTRYLADVAQRDYDQKKHEKGRYLKVGNDMEFIRYVEMKIGSEHFSPVATLMSMKDTGIRTRICHRTLYRYIHSGVFLNLTSKLFTMSKIVYIAQIKHFIYIAYLCNIMFLYFFLIYYCNFHL